MPALETVKLAFYETLRTARVSKAELARPPLRAAVVSAWRLTRSFPVARVTIQSGRRCAQPAFRDRQRSYFHEHSALACASCRHLS
jgi:hypothetical protein